MGIKFFSGFGGCWLMKRIKTNGFGLDMVWLVLGAASYTLVGWRWSAPAAAWIALIFLDGIGPCFLCPVYTPRLPGI
jgi:hypothetical protein